MRVKQILFIDNDTDFLNTQKDYLEGAGYSVRIVNLLADAERILREEWTHLLILDVRLVDDTDEKDISGLLLAKRYPYIPKIIHTRYPDLQLILLNLSETLVPLGKDADPDELIQRVEQLLAERVRLNWTLEIEWGALDSFALVRRIEPGLENRLLENRSQELEDLFRTLFYKKQHIKFDKVLWQRDGRVALSVLAFAPDRSVTSYVVVCGQAAQIAQEAAHYHEFAPKAAAGLSTLLGAHDHAQTAHLGALGYTLVGADLEHIRSLRALYDSAPERVFHVALEQLSTRTLPSWEGERVLGTSGRTEAQEYRERLCLGESAVSRAAWNARLAELVQASPTLGVKIELNDTQFMIQIENQRSVFTHPLTALDFAFVSERPVLLGNAPGRLSGENILADAEGHAWLTDLAEVAPAPLYWNLAALDALIRFDWMEEANIRYLLAMEQALVKHALGEVDARDLEPRLKKNVRALAKLEQLTTRTVGRDKAAYLLGVYFQAARRLAAFNPAVPVTPTERARLVHILLSMAVLAHALAESSGVQPGPVPRNTGIVLNPNNQSATVEGRVVELTQTEFKLLSYLIAHPNQVCSREALFQSAFGKKYEPHEEAHLNTEMGRLRAKIQKESRAQYLHTKRGVGYRLDPHPEQEG